ncbi:MAG: alpha/beta fold hydrolase, partial [Chlamydiae bacterium]|nr:alpha/beta fold hydrolase [Chlamydiota bacterium]
VSGYYEGFDPLILSTEIGVRKPDPEAYRIMLKKLGLKPHEVLFIDDRIENIAAARALGIETHHFESSSKLKRSCIKLGLLEEERVEFDEHSIWVESLGSPKDPAILLIAGAGCHAHFWTDELVQELVSEGYFVIRYDQRDTGLSTPFPRSYILEDLADDAVMILDHFGYEQAHVVGHSMGGYVGQLLAARYPNVVTSLTVVGAGPAFETADTKKPLNEQEKRTLGGYFKLVFANRPNESFAESLPKFITVWEHSNGSYPLDIAMVTSYVDELYNRTLHSFSMSHHHLEAMEEILHGLDKRGSVPQMITMPTLVIQGGQDPLVLPHRGGIALYKALPQAELKLFPKMGHMLFNRQLEEQFIDTLKEFLYGI